MVWRDAGLEKSGVCHSTANMGGVVSSNNISAFGRRRMKSIYHISCDLEGERLGYRRCDLLWSHLLHASFIISNH